MLNCNKIKLIQFDTKYITCTPSTKTPFHANNYKVMTLFLRIYFCQMKIQDSLPPECNTTVFNLCFISHQRYVTRNRYCNLCTRKSKSYIPFYLKNRLLVGTGYLY